MTAILAGQLNGCGGGGTNNWSTPVIPISSIPTIGSGMIELWPISGGSVSWITSDGASLGSYTTASDGSISYNPRDIVSRMGNSSHVILTVSRGVDTDADDDGIIDATSTPIGGSFRMIIMRESIEKWEHIVVNPRAGVVSEILLGRSNATISQGALDHISRETGADDQNNDGVINYRDLTTIQMKNTTGVSAMVPAMSGYIASVHSGDTSAKQRSLINIAKTENHILATIVANPTTTDHTPALRLESLSGGNILYTLDGSSPISWGSGTRVGVSGMIIPMQWVKIYYREQFTLGGATVLGKVKGFDLIHDWTTLAQEAVAYNTIGVSNTTTDTLTYKNTSYTITTLSNTISPAYTYPKTIDCKIGLTAGCHLGPYMAWSQVHEARIRSMITTGAQDYVDNSVVIPPISLMETIRSNISYNGAAYTITDIWTPWPSNTKVFPVTITANITRRNGQAYTITKTATSQSELTNMNTQIEQETKIYIDVDTAQAPGIKVKNTYETIENWTPYRSSSYMIQVIWNTSGSTTSNYPTTVQGIYKSPQTGYNVEINTAVNTDLERTSATARFPAVLQARIDNETIIIPTPTCTLNQIKRENYTNYRWAYYQSVTVCNMSGTADYPMQITAEYTLPGTSTVYVTPGTSTVSNSTQRQEQTDYHLSIAKARIDAALDDVYPPSYTRTTPREYYGWGSYYYQVDYSKYVGKDFPADLWAYITYQNGYNEWPISIKSGALDEWQITASINIWNTYAQGQIDNYNPTYNRQELKSDGPYKYGSRGSTYTTYVRYNMKGENKNYPAMVWIDYKSGTSGALKNTWDTYGNTWVNNSVEKEQIKTTLLQFVQWQVLALSPTSDTIWSTQWKLASLLPISTAHAATPSSILVQKSFTTLPAFATYSSNTVLGKFLGYSGSVLDHIVGNRPGKSAVAGGDKSKLALQKAITEIW
jgi:hypothetical protein